MRQKREHIVGIVFDRELVGSGIFERRPGTSEAPQIRRDEPPALRDAMQLREPLIGTEWERVKQNECAAGARIQIPQRAVRKMRDVTPHGSIVWPLDGVARLMP